MNRNEIAALVTAALREDIGTGDLSAALIDASTKATAHIMTRESAVLCGTPWASEVFKQVDPMIVQNWQAEDGDKLAPSQIICTLTGAAANLLTAERTALNFLQTLSATATRTAYFVDLIRDTHTVLLDTRKTIPGLRFAQKYAVRVGGGQNHRQGLFDAILIKENHIMACGSISAAIKKCENAHVKVIVEVENLDELREAIAAGATHIMLDNFSVDLIKKAVGIKYGGVKLEASGGVNEYNIREIALAGVDYISLGTLTKDIHAVDLSMRFITG